MRLHIRLSAALAAMAVAASLIGEGAGTSLAAQVQQSQPSTTRSPWTWMKSKIRRLQGEAKRQAGSPATESDSHGRFGWTFHDIDVQTALRRMERFGLKVPVDVEGRATIKIRVGVPWRHAFTERDYRLYAWIDSPRLKVAGVETDDFHAALSYVDGVLKLAELRLATPEFSAAGGKAAIRGDAQVQLEPRGDATANLDFERLALAPLIAAIAEARPKSGIDQATLDKLKLGGVAGGHADAKVAIDRFRDIAAWQVGARLNVADLRAFAAREFVLNATAKLERGVARLDRLEVRMHDAPARLAGDATLQLEPLGQLQARLKLDQLELAQLVEGDRALAKLFSGRVGASFEAAAALDRIQDPAAWNANGQLNAADLRAAGLPPVRLGASFRLGGGRFSVSNLAGEADFFRLDGGGEIALNGDFDYSANVRLTSSRLSRLNQLAPDSRLPIEIGGRLGAAAVVQGALKSRTFSAKGGVNARDVRVEQLEIERLEFRYAADGKQLQLHPIEAGLYGGQLRASAVVPLDDQGELRAGLRWSDLPLESLLRPMLEKLGGSAPSLAGRAAGTLELSAPGGALSQAPLDWRQWTARGRIDLDRLSLPASGAALVSAGRAGARLRLESGKLRVDELKGGWGSTTLDGSGNLNVTAPYDFDAQLAVSNFDLAILGQLPAAVRPPVTVSGRTGVSAKLNGALEPLQIAGSGALLARQIQVNRVRIDSVSANVAIDKEQFRLSRLQAKLYGGELDGSLTAPLEQHAAGRAKLVWRDVQLGRLMADWQAASNYLTGRSQGRVELAAPFDALRDPTNWRGEISLSANDFPVWGWSVRSAALDADLDAGELKLTKFAVETRPTARQPATTLSGSGRLNVAAPYDFQVRFKLDGLDLGRLRTLPAKLRPPVPLGGLVDGSGHAQGTLEPLSVAGQGKIAAAGVEVANARIDSLTATVVADEKVLELQDISAQLYEGRINGDIRLPLIDTLPGRISFDVQRVDFGELAADLARLSFKLSGLVDAQLKADIPPGRLMQPAEWQARATADAPEILVNSLRFGKLHGQVEYRQAALDYQADGELLDGRWKIAGVWQQGGDERRSSENRGSLQVNGAQLSRLSEIFRRSGAAAALAGTFGAQLSYRHAPATGAPVGNGKFEIVELREGGVLLSDRVAGAIRATPEAITLEDLAGSLAGGLLRASGEWFLKPGRRSRFHVSLYAVDLNALLKGRLPPDVRVVGAVDADALVFAGQGRPWQLDGSATVREAEIDGIPFNDVRSAFDGLYDPSSARGELHLRDATAQLAYGHITASASAVSAGGLTIDAHGKFADVNVHQLLKRWSSASQYGTGKMTGDFTLAGRNVQSVDDLSGALKAKLRDTQAASLPLAQNLQSYIAGGLTTSSRFGNGDLRARLARGVIRIQRLSLSSPNLQLFVQGGVSLAGRLNLSVVANTGQVNSTPALLLIAARLSTLVAPPVGLLLEANQFLSNQVVYLDVTGTIHSPTIRIRPLPMLEEEAIRFFLLEAPIP